MRPGGAVPDPVAHPGPGHDPGRPRHRRRPALASGRWLARAAAVAALQAVQAVQAQGLAAAPAAPQDVQVPSLEAVRGVPLRLPAAWFPAAVEGRAPALVLLHGCSGAYDGRGRLAARYAELAAQLHALGVHALVTDSFTPRGERQLCTQRHAARRITQTERRRDALGAVAWLAAQPQVDPARIGLLGWSHGGSAVLATTNLRDPEVRAAAGQGTRPSLAVAYYPGCGAELLHGFAPSAPLLMLLGEADDWTPPAPCKALAAGADTSAAPPPQLEAYAGAFHGCDGTGPVRLRTDVPNGAQPGRGVHVGGDAAARAASQARLEAFLRQQWKLAP